MAMKNTVLVSVVIISLNKEKELRECLDSVIMQDYGKIEVIVIDNGSFVPGVLEMLKEYQGQIILKKNKLNLGTCVARNQGIKAAKGKYILFLDDDALILDKDTISRAVKRMENNPEIGELGAIYYADKEKKKIYLTQCITGYDGFLDRRKSTQVFTEISFNKRMHIPTCFALVRKNVLEAVGGFDPFFYYYEEDNDLSMRIMKKGYHIAVDPQLSVYHVSGTRQRESFEKYRNKTYLILKSYNFGFKIAFAFTLIKRLLCAKSLSHLTDAWIRLGFLCFYVLLYPMVFYRRNINFLEGGQWLDRFSYNSLDIFAKLMEFSLRVEGWLFPKNDKSLFLFVTNYCNAKCGHCFYWKYINNKDEEMCLGEFKKIARSLQKQINRVIITGGEPFLRNDLVDICKVFLKNRRIQVLNLVTNGMLSTKIHNDVREILNCSTRNIRVLIVVSLDGFEKTHDRIRKTPGLFVKAVDTIHQLKSLQKKFKNLEVSAVTTVTKENYYQIKDLNTFVENELGVYHRINLVRSSRTEVFGVSRDLISDFSPEMDTELTLDISEVESICDYFLNKRNWSEYHKMILRYSLQIIRGKKKLFDCQAPYSNIVIYPNGEMSFCEFLKPIVNIRDKDFRFQELWNAKECNELRNKLKNCVCTHPCNLGQNLADNPQLQGVLPAWPERNHKNRVLSNA